jgi:hypothetical protein
MQGRVMIECKILRASLRASKCCSAKLHEGICVYEKAVNPIIDFISLHLVLPTVLLQLFSPRPAGRITLNQSNVTGNS